MMATIIFALLFIAASLHRDSCIANFPDNTWTDKYTGAYALSWTTFSTVVSERYYAQSHTIRIRLFE